MTCLELDTYRIKICIYKNCVVFTSISMLNFIIKWSIIKFVQYQIAIDYGYRFNISVLTLIQYQIITLIQYQNLMLH